MLCAEPMERGRAIELSGPELPGRDWGNRSTLVSWSWGGSGGKEGSRVLLNLCKRECLVPLGSGAHKLRAGHCWVA